jgi:NAD(P)-dependent dehydrogenase (short-subunit alcohol dehydrogenase family)
MTASGPCIVTGSSTGIGGATVARLLAAGREVVSLDIKDPPPGVADHHHCDLADPASIEATAARLDGRYASLLNIAGVPGTVPSELVGRVNVFGLRLLTEMVFDRIVDGGTVVNVSSIAGNTWKRRLGPIQEMLATTSFAEGVAWWNEHAAGVGADPYTFSKEAVVVYTMQLAREGLSRGIQVNDVGPGPVNTPLLPAFREQAGPDQMDWLNSQVGRVGQPDDIAEVLEWLAVGDHRWLNGNHITVDGGISAGLASKWVDSRTAPARRGS